MTQKAIHLLYGAACLALITLSGCKDNEKDLTNTPSITLSQLAQDTILQAKPEVAEEYINKAQKEAKDSSEYYLAESVRSSLLLNNISVDSALNCIDRIKNFCSQQPRLNILHYTMLTMAEYNQGLILQYRQQADSAIAVYRHVAEYSLKSMYPKWIPAVYCKLGDLYGMKNDFPLQAYYYRRGLLVADSLNIPEIEKFSCYSALGASYLSVRDFELSGEYLAKAYKLKDRLTLQEQFLAFNNYINYYYYQKKYDQAWKYMEMLYELIEPHKDSMPYEDAMIKGNYADLALRSGKNMEKAEEYIKESKTLFASVGVTFINYYLESMQLSLAIAKNDLQEAQELVARFEKEPTDNVQIDHLSFRNSALIAYYKKMHDYEKALALYEANSLIEDSLRSDRQKKYVADLNLRYMNDTTHLRNRITISTQENKIALLRLEVISGFAVMFILIVGFIEYRKKIQKSRRQQFEQHLYEISKLKMQNIREKISPHFIFNVLNREINTHPESEMEYSRLMQLTKLLRKGLSLSNQLAIPLADELDFVSTYVSLLQDTGTHFSFHLYQEEDVDTAAVKVPSMIIQIPVENAIKHGFAGIGQGILDLSVKRMPNGIQITVWNNGQKYVPFQSGDNGNTGTGLKVIYQTLVLMNARNREHITFDIHEKEGTEVCIYIPYSYNYNQ
ncbi:tetratricopeptide repeat-containing sensor histidine kinase [Bacteroides timonensis]|uniref:tetratricopeptide repeat-containing sensor histidine kinase n=1 Tax=Bacteroides timonensis TaxID=1470345 RepID=UPI0005C62883|nr:histidine kinase [Bacteroides timonensis]